MNTEAALTNSKSKFIPIFVLLFSMLIFWIDISLPLGVAAGVPYVIAILFTWNLRDKTFTIALSIFCCLLTLAGFYLSEQTVDIWIAIANRIMAVGVIWSTAWLILIIHNNRKEIIKINAEQEEVIQAQTKVLSTTLEETAKINEKMRKANKALINVTADLTESEENLRRQKSQLDYFIRHTPAAVAMFDSNLNYIIASDRWYKDYGIEGRAIIGQNHYDVFPEIRNNEEWVDIHKRSLSGETIHSDEDLFVRDDGVKQWLKYDIYPWYEPNGDQGGIGMFTEDITYAKQQEIKLRESEEKYRLTVNSSSIGIALVGLDGKWLSVNPAITQIFGYCEQEMLAMDFQSITHPDDLDKDLLYVQMLIEGKIDNYEMEKRYFHKEGNTIWAQLNVSIVRSREDEPEYFISQIQNITTRKNALNSLKKSEERFNLAIAGTNDGIWDWPNVNESHEWWSPQFYVLLGYEVNEIESSLETFRELLHPDDRDRTTQAVKEHFETDVPFNIEYRLKTKSGKYRWFRGKGIVVRDENATPLRMVGSISDIHRTKQIERQIKKLNFQLEEKVEARTKQLKTINNELEAFSYSVSHDLRSPLRTIHGFCQALEEDFGKELPHEAKGYLKRVTAASVRMGMLIDDVLDLSRISRKKFILKEFDFTALVNEVVDALRDETDTDFEIHVEQDMIATGDMGLLRIAMQNLIGNSVKYSSKERNALIEVGEKSLNEGTVVYYVKDNGVGFDMRYADKLFRAFQRLHSNKEFEGTGIGLATVNRIINRHHGKIWAESELDVGTTFFFSLNT